MQITEPDGWDATDERHGAVIALRDPRRGVLDPLWTAWFEGLAIGSDDSQTVISGPVADQAALRGLLNRVCDLGLVLISVRRLDPG
ncbi:MAG TPA: hypothetical protein VMK84_19415 [Streptosporangiaceae bacterium]|nr:hypothetical protein [Streptosporangiaceae bacterium]